MAFSEKLGRLSGAPRHLSATEWSREPQVTLSSHTCMNTTPRVNIGLLVYEYLAVLQSCKLGVIAQAELMVHPPTSPLAYSAILRSFSQLQRHSCWTTSSERAEYSPWTCCFHSSHLEYVFSSRPIASFTRSCADIPVLERISLALLASISRAWVTPLGSQDTQWYTLLRGRPLGWC